MMGAIGWLVAAAVVEVAELLAFVAGFMIEGVSAGVELFLWALTGGRR